MKTEMTILILAATCYASPGFCRSTPDVNELDPVIVNDVKMLDSIGGYEKLVKDYNANLKQGQKQITVEDVRELKQMADNKNCTNSRVIAAQSPAALYVLMCQAAGIKPSAPIVPSTTGASQ